MKVVAKYLGSPGTHVRCYPRHVVRTIGQTRELVYRMPGPHRRTRSKSVQLVGRPSAYLFSSTWPRRSDHRCSRFAGAVRKNARGQQLTNTGISVVISRSLPENMTSGVTPDHMKRKIDENGNLYGWGKPHGRALTRSSLVRTPQSKSLSKSDNSVANDDLLNRWSRYHGRN